MQTLKITNPLYVGSLAPLIQNYVKRVPFPGVTYESFYAFLASIAQYGGINAELWVVLDADKQPLAFAVWSVLGSPHVGTTFMGHIYSKAKNKKITLELVQQWEKFGLEKNCPIFMFDAVNESVCKYFEGLAKEIGYDIKRTGLIHCVGRKEK